MLNNFKALVASAIALFFASCQSQTTAERSESIKYEQYMYQGEQLYQLHCLNCHQKDGSGLGKLIPPLTTSFLKTQQDLVICGIKYGLKGPLKVDSVTYNGVMPGVQRLTPLEIAEILTYINNSWGNENGPVTIQEVSKALGQCGN